MSDRYGTQTTVFLNGADLDCDVRRLAGNTARSYLTLRCDGFGLLRVHYDRPQAARLIRALCTGAHEAMQDAELSCAEWDVVLRGLDAMVNTALGRRAEAFHAEFGEVAGPLAFPATDHCGDHVDQAVTEGSA